MRNQPKYHFMKNSTYALSGLKEVLENETSFKIELILFCFLSAIIWFTPITFISKAILQGSLFIPLLIEIINSAIERTVDLVTTEYNEMAKRAKDAGSAAVLISLLFTCFIWLCVIINEID